MRGIRAVARGPRDRRPLDGLGLRYNRAVHPALPRARPGVADVELLRGARAPADVLPSLLVEAPHGATTPEDYEALRARLVSALPQDLHEFFYVNTDVGSWEYGRRVAALALAAAPERAALVIRCRIPRTFVDVNRDLGAVGGDLARGQLTAAIPPFITADADLALLGELHAAYAALVERAYAAICGAGGYALVAHTYGPRTLGIATVDRDIIHNLRWAHEPARVETWPMRAELDLLTRPPLGDGDGLGDELAPPGLADALVARYAALGLRARQNDTYNLHPNTMAHTWSRRFPGRLLCVEVRRDLLVERWAWNQPMRARPSAVDRVAAPLADALARIILSEETL